MEQGVNKLEEEFFLLPNLRRIPFIVHGFGKAAWKGWRLPEPLERMGFRLVLAHQVHSNKLCIIQHFPEKKVRGDALATELPFLLLGIKTADCLPVLVVDEERRVIAAVHCGWRGTMKRIVQNVILGLGRIYGCRPDALLLAMGPCIGRDCYEVGEDVLMHFKREGLNTSPFRPSPKKRGKYFLDLKEANMEQLLELGIKRENISQIDLCTHCEKGLVSFRRDRSDKERMLSFIGMIK